MARSDARRLRRKAARSNLWQQQPDVLFEQRLRFAAAMFCDPPGQPLLDNVEKCQLRSQQVCEFYGAFYGAIGAVREVRRDEQMLNGSLR